MSEEKEPLTDKKFNACSKAVFYQLFNRKLSFIVFTGNEESYNKWLFTNVAYETILMYDSKPDYVYSLVTIKDEDYLERFYTVFPLLKTTACLIYVVDFLSTLSKVPDTSKCTLKQNREDIILEYTSNDEVVEKIVGRSLLDIDVDMYYTVWKSGLITSNHPYSRLYEFSEIKEVDSRTILRVMDSDGSDQFHPPRNASTVVQFGYMIPYLSMFIKSIPKQSQEFTILAGYDKDSVILNAHYDTDFLSCITTQPAQKWFVAKQNNSNT